ncbi:hypothetical protein XNC1_2659 [Xenorhabdus nematophila ATCC 19061]|uniref:Uncharacterized protein n=1 Tax=Xenorhabdus nematophila (strain ATCC 19061 / DSM 3370 / CCUG 14189 / LMG 1036 / NCIMB 9965 / AN6) TaxID=406817 RepID=D3VI73_XENNA|nr:hypothetical protein XNC1_2659 [Xenorhabdus nematophila ATCC 19061]CEE94882.1 hypothetical protein XNA1_4830011 [Xenorhabdus nematophila str. Anatoliense]CEK23552.1 hypothetical protein XNC2_2558 [Xenorhabdus nematophila AN6/1]
MGTHWVVQAVNETQIMMENISFLILIIRTHPVCKAFSYNLSAFTLVIVLIFISKERLSRFLLTLRVKYFCHGTSAIKNQDSIVIRFVIIYHCYYLKQGC